MKTFRSKDLKWLHTYVNQVFITDKLIHINSSLVFQRNKYHGQD